MLLALEDCDAEPLELDSRKRIDFVVRLNAFNDFPIVLFSDGVEELKLVFRSNTCRYEVGCVREVGLEGGRFGVLLTAEKFGDSGRGDIDAGRAVLGSLKVGDLDPNFLLLVAKDCDVGSALSTATAECC